MIKVEAEPLKVEARSISEIERDDVARKVLEAAAVRIESQHGNPTYALAWKGAARTVRAMKP